MRKIIDNNEKKLLDEIKSSLTKTELAKFAVGYFFISGFKEIYQDIENITELKLLIGNATDRQTCEQLAEANLAPNLPEYEMRQAKFRNDEKKRKIVLNTEDDLSNRISQLHQTDENIKFIESLKKLIQSGKLKINIYTKGRLHAKCYLMFFKKDQDKKGEVIVGSSNLSLGGLKNNSELNVSLPEEYIREINDWFDNLWEDSDPFDKNLIQLIENSWVEYHPTPYELYLKVIYEIVKDKLFETEEFEEDNTMPELYNYQKDAVIQAKSIIEKYNGVFISDVVGLGKTYVGSRLLYDLTLKYNDRALVICSPGLAEYWREILDDFGVRADVQSNSYDNLQKIVESKRLMKRKFVLVDEAHKFKNSDSKSYRLMSEICFDKKVVLVTATPQNLSPEDIMNQMKLFHPHDWTDIPIDPQFLSEFFNQVIKGKRKIGDLLRHILIRRTRKHIETYYHEDMKRADLKFPVREKPRTIDYSIEKVYGNQKVYGDIEKLISNLSYARYDIFSYSKPEYRNEVAFKQLKTAYENLRGLMKVLFFKELESSICAFRTSIEKLINSHRNFLDMYELGIIQTKQSGDELIDYLSSSDNANVEEYFLDSSKIKFTADQFNENLKTKVGDDLLTFEKIFNLIKIVRPEHDDKLNQLKKNLKGILSRENKILIFTQFSTTAKYIYDNIFEEFKNVGMASSKSKNIVRIAQKFSPGSFKDIGVDKKDQIDILVSTDVLSEGSNLQDCNTVINFDLHWNPVRLIQRLGRVDRVSTQHNFINNYNFFPEKEVEARLGLRERVEKRIREIQATLGEDAKYLSENEKINKKGFFQIYTGDQKIFEEQDLVESLGDNELILKLRELKEKEPKLFDKITRMQKRLHTAKSSSKNGIVVFCKASDMQSFYFTNSRGEILTTDRDEILNLMKCEKGYPASELPANFNVIVNGIQAKFEEEIKKRVYEMESRESDPAMRFVLRDIGILRRGASEALKRRIEKLNEFVRGKVLINETAKKELRKLNRSKDTSLKEEYVSDLEKILYESGNTKRIDEEKLIKRQQEVYTEVIASEGLV